MRKLFVVVLLLTLPAFPVKRKYGWVPTSDAIEQFTLLPNTVYAVGPWDSVPLRVSMEADMNLAASVFTLDAWNALVANPSQAAGVFSTLSRFASAQCFQQGSAKLDLTCEQFDGIGPYVVVFYDPRSVLNGSAVLIGALGVYTHNAEMVKQAVAQQQQAGAANNVLVTRYRWGCTENCPVHHRKKQQE